MLNVSSHKIPWQRELQMVYGYAAAVAAVIIILISINLKADHVHLDYKSSVNMFKSVI